MLTNVINENYLVVGWAKMIKIMILSEKCLICPPYPLKSANPQF